MASTSYGVNHDLAVKLWSKKLFQEALKATYFSKFMGKGTGNIVQIKDETSKSAGDKITVGLRMQLSGDGVQGDGTLEGNEEALSTYADAVYIDQLRHAVRSAGKMSEQRVPFSVREEAKDGLRDWWQDRLDTWFFNQLCGNTLSTLGTKFTGNQAAIAPSSGKQIWADGTTDETLTSAGVFNLNLIDKCVEKAKTASPLIRPVKVGGKDKFVMFLHPYQVYDLRTTTSDGQWLDIQKAAMSGGDVSKNAIYDGSLGEYNGVILHESTRIPGGVNSTTSAAVASTRRAVFCGAQAAVMAYGKDDSGEMSWVEELFDYGNQLGVSAGMIAGLKKTRFNSADFGTIVVSTYAAAH
jgi:N4-gp56 family major capsid protein